ncbi:MAG: hypothetical protein GWN58_28530 [Anaerolineae bacterium]|nr:hypothetical protein [Anaerolineae bacterium]
MESSHHQTPASQPDATAGQPQPTHQEFRRQPTIEELEEQIETLTHYLEVFAYDARRVVGELRRRKVLTPAGEERDYFIGPETREDLERVLASIEAEDEGGAYVQG